MTNKELTDYALFNSVMKEQNPQKRKQGLDTLYIMKTMEKQRERNMAKRQK